MLNYELDNNSNKNKHKKAFSNVVFSIAKTVFGIFIFVSVIVLLAYGYKQFSYRFATLKKVYVNGNSILKVSYIVGVGVGKLGRPLSSYNMSKIYMNILSIPWIKSVRVASIYPDTIIISVVEKQPGALVYIDKQVFIVSLNGDLISKYSGMVNLPKNIEKIHLNSKSFLNNKDLIKSVIAFYEKLDKIAKINYIEIVSDSYQIAHLRNGLNVGIDSFDCPEIALRRFKYKLPYLLKIKNKLENVSICFSNKFVLKWKKGVVK